MTNGLWQLPANAVRKKPRAPGQRNKQPERSLQIRVANMLRWMLPPEVPWTAIGHGGGGERRGQILKRMGVMPGWPDIHFIWRGQACYIELKASGGTLSPAQREVHAKIKLAGGNIVTCKDEEQVVAFLQSLGIPLQARLMPADRAAKQADFNHG